MILVDTYVWIDHFRNGNHRLAELFTLDRKLYQTWQKLSKLVRSALG